jgi:hypothetical protein
MSADTITLFLLRELDGFKRELEMFPDDESVWKTVPGVTNSAGNLALHIAGNLQHYVGRVLGGSAYVRNREIEFGRRNGTRTELIAELDKAAAAVRGVLPGLSAGRWDEEFPELILGHRIRTGVFLHHLSVHAGFHLAQAGYLRRALTGDSRSSGPIPLGPLAGHGTQG